MRYIDLIWFSKVERWMKWEPKLPKAQFEPNTPGQTRFIRKPKLLEAGNA